MQAERAVVNNEFDRLLAAMAMPDVDARRMSLGGCIFVVVVGGNNRSM